MAITRHNVQLQYGKKEVRRLLTAASQHTVEKGGRYTTQDGSIHIEPSPQATEPSTLTFDWNTQRLATIDCDEGLSRPDILAELGTLEELAFGKKKHGQ